MDTVLEYQVFLSNTNNFHTDTWFQAFLSSTYNFHGSIWPIDGTLTSVTIPVQSESGNNGNKGALQHQMLFTFITRISLFGGDFPAAKDAVSLCILGIIYIYIYHHDHVVPLARISLTLSRHFSLSFIASGRSSGQHPVSSHSCCMYVRAGHSAFAWPYVEVHRSTSLMSSSLFL